MTREDSTESVLALCDALERVTDGVAALDADLRYTVVNEAAAELLGRSPDELEGTTVSGSFGGDTDVEERLETAMETGSRTTFEHYDAERDRWLEIRAHPDEGGLSLALIDVTERKGRERELERQEYLFDSVQGLIDVGMWEYDPATDRLFWSDGVRAIHGVDDSYEPTVSEAIDFYHPDDRDVIAAAVEDALEHGERFDLDLRIVRTDGEIRDVRTHGEVVSADGQSGGVLRGAFQDITERKERERELERVRAFVENSSDTISVVDEDGVIQYSSAAAYQEGGVPPESLVDRSAFERIHPDDRAEAERTFERALANPGEKYVCQYRGRQADGSWVWLESTCVRPADGDIEGLVVVTRDIAERKRRAQERRALSEEYEAVFENADDGIFLVDVETEDGDPVFRYSRLNPSHEERTGLTTAAVKGRTPREVLGEDTGRVAETHYRRCVETRSAVTYDESVTPPDVDGVWQTRLAPVVVDGEVARVVGIARDVTERVEHERELRRKNARLDEFASVISHDIRNPLSVALGRVQLLDAGSESEHLPPVLRSLVRIEAIVDDTLTLARHGETVAETEPISITGLAGQCWGTVDVADAILEVDDEFTLHGDRDRLRHVFENLFRNSVEHGSTSSRSGADDSVDHGSTGSRPDADDSVGHGEPSVTVRVGRLGDDGLYVADDGPGIPEPERETVFEPGHKSSAGGTGFGLTIVRRIVEAHGWTVTAAESETGGARFEFRGVDIEDAVDDETSGD
ncbi:PAS domain-containing sensor histidine kinase [Salinigranum rubrum]|uniref:histidine kinase n=1 Tax=Salinigranum rubrum TaxID=755307 RepID=A0A2I8VI92_9EURY|nr:PAS domain-containing sensor histidine kinase [Salinigranum rubrum]AUV80769.1 PAS domain-containing sensor histidine kinase [Salinigranum rubrum]